MPHACELKEQAAQLALVVRTRTPVEGLPQVLGQAYGAIAQYLMESGGQRAGAPFVAYHNADMQDLDIEVGFPVTERLDGTDAIQATEIPEGTYATCLHEGPYTELHQTYATIAQWMADNGHEAAGPSYEMYLNDPSQVSPEQLRTQIAFLLKS